ncbi:beta-ketoacyl-ACP synthase 3 [Faecalicatena contorta]|uniref:3-oxoacyl-[acyl-carrier-protein] synthase III n=1 Tax=Faecalicatena contorta TaxID=39482 RepID=A0A316A3R9_9FIRM|nr:beta-ketoacyl-ACP synthase 3 [Faecalicatena contorta]PWJ52315.1 3-oxoacyl-[acyl-carrier-protein] synthase III [Faecalicatena contorta]SUQ12593.1 3-oxoacyl-[acyl-carrier-protein] synthase III [Faecalicatena contorta]
MNINSNYIITAIGSYLPERKLTNFDFEKMVDTSDEWIIKRTGIHTKFISADNEFASDLGIKAVQNLMDNYPVTLKDIDMIIATVFVYDHLTPSVSAIVAEHFGINMAGTYDLHAESSSFAYGLITANAYIASGQAKKVLLVTAETPSKELDHTDPGTCILFGGGATATLIEKNTSPKKFVSNFRTDGNLADKVYCTQFSSAIKRSKFEKEHFIQQDDRALYAYVVKNISNYIKCLLDEAGLTTSDIDWFIPHSANLRMIEALRERLEFDETKMLTSVEQCGNTSSSIPLAIILALKDGRIKRGDKILIYGFGEGITYAGAIIEW